MTQFNNLPNIILGYHGCERDIGEEILGGRRDWQPSENDYDWLGPGIYFWESNPDRALSFATEKMRRGEIRDPFVVGAALTLGNCIDTLSETSIVAIRTAYKQLVRVHAAANTTLPKNAGGRDLLLKRLDCAVIQTLHQMLSDAREPQVDSCRGLYHEGQPIYDTSSFYEKSHIQICVVNQRCIKGVFRHNFV